MLKFCAILLVLSIMPLARAQSAALDDGQQSRILGMENAWNQAVQRKDGKALLMLLAPELVYVDYDGKLMNRDEYLTKVASASLQPLQVASDSMTVHFFGTAAVVTGMYREKGVQEGKPYSLHERFTDTWLSRNGTWICVASQSTRVGN